MTMPDLEKIERTNKAVRYALLERVVFDWKLGPKDMPTSLNLDEVDLPISVKEVVTLLQKLQANGLIHDLVIDKNRRLDRMAHFRCTPDLERYHRALLVEISCAGSLVDDALRSTFDC